MPKYRILKNGLALLVLPFLTALLVSPPAWQPVSLSVPIRIDYQTYLPGPVRRGRIAASPASRTGSGTDSGRGGTADDFSFTKKWEYPPGVARMSNGKPGCDDGGFCPERCLAMLDKRGRIPKDSIKTFYSLLDTTHIHQSIQSTAWCYEWAGTTVVRAFRLQSGTGSSDTIRCESAMNEATHCSLRLDLVPPYCYATIILNSITSGGAKHFFCKGGTVRLDKSHWQRGILKTRFDLTFANTSEPDKPMFWRGKIYVPVEGLAKK